MASIAHSQTIVSGLAAATLGYVSAGTVVERGQRQETRYTLRSSLRRVSRLKRLRSCGLPLGSAMVVRLKGAVHHYSGMSTCGSGWACPVCAAKIRYHRANEASRAVVAALDKGMEALFVTRTIPHSAEDKLGVTLGLLAEGRRYVSNQKLVKAVRQVQLGGVALAIYVAKVQEGSDIRLYTAHELARADLKQGRLGSLMPFDIACQSFDTGDMAALDLWHEYERETIGKSVIRFTKGLRARLLPDEAEKTDEELAALQVGGIDVLRFSGWFYRKIARVPGLEGKVLTALDTGGFAALVELLTVYHLDEPGGYWQFQDKESGRAGSPLEG